MNIASGRAVEISEALEILRRHARAEFEIRVDPARLRGGGARVSVGRADRLEALTGWRPAHAFEETVVGVLNAFRARRRLEH